MYLNGGDDLSEILLGVESAAGEVLMLKRIKEIGYIAYFLDSEGSRVALRSML
ncbi:hypothetical protein [Marinomonas balearica]|uniref:hypothetical protein n=1 Tax=Marinomonas balearica TaxID=491947 RepID=UPI0014152945|nr:hypothetical protein [Marinomonas balearica]